MVYACAYPIIHTFDAAGGAPITYQVSVDGVNIYNGYAYPVSTSARTLDIDISQICRTYLEARYEDAPWRATALVGINGTFATFVVSSGSNPGSADVSYDVVYNYNTDYTSSWLDTYLANAPLTFKVDPRQKLALSSFRKTGASRFYYSINGVQTTFSLTSTLIQTMQIDLLNLGVKPGDYLYLSGNGSGLGFDVIEPCRSHFVLHYVNKIGGLDSLLCNGRVVESYIPTRTDARLYNDRNSRLDFEATRINQTIERRYELNTRFLQYGDFVAGRIDNLIYSPKVWIENLETKTVTACLIVDSNYTIQSERNDGLIQYTINVRESQQYIRR